MVNAVFKLIYVFFIISAVQFRFFQLVLDVIKLHHTCVKQQLTLSPSSANNPFI